MKRKRLLSGLLAFVMMLTMVLNSIPVFAEEQAATEFDHLREKWQYLAVGGDYDPGDPDMQQLLQSINTVAEDLLERINPDPTPGWGPNDYLWEEYILGNRGSAYSDSNNTQFTIRALKFMALAFQTKGCLLYQNEQLRNEILRGMDYIYQHHFKAGIETNSYGNWFTWEIGGPIYLSETVLLMYDYLTAEQIELYMSAALRGANKTGGDAYMYVGANALWRDRVRLYSGILLREGAILEYVQKDVPKYMGYVTSGDGYYRDGTFMQHGNIVYNGGYGKEAFSDISLFLYMLDNSSWAITGPEKDNMSTIVEKSYIPFMYKGVFMDMVRGREITRKDTTDAYAGITINLDVLLYSETVPEDERKRLKGMVKEWMNNDNAIKTLNEGAGVAWYLFPVYNLSKTLEILKDESIQPVSNSGTSYTFGKGARTVHSTDDFTFGLSMYSKDIKTYESGDSNTKGWYTGLGQTFVYTTDIGQYTYQKPTIDWHRLSGVTAVSGITVGGHTNLSPFGGSTTLKSSYSTAGLEISPGSTQVSAKKSWFMFDDEVAALGSGITSSHTNQVETTIDNHYITGDNALIINGEKQSAELGWNGSIDDAKWALIEGNVEGSNIGVYFPEETKIGAVRNTRSGKWTDLGSYNVDENVQSANYLTMWVDHGSKPVDGKYAYVLLPGTTEAQVEHYADSSDIEVIRHDNEVHAVYEKTLHMLGANFWQDGDQSIDAMGVKDYLSVDKMSSVMVQEDDHKLSVALSDTTKSNSGIITVDINRAALGVISRDDRVKVIQTSPSIRFEVDVSNSFGNPIEAEFSYVKIAAPGETSITTMTLNDITLDLEFEAASRAIGYKLEYGTETGKYTHSLVSSSHKAKLQGLQANTTYYFAVRAINDSGEGELSGERTFTIGNMRMLVDEYEDFSKVLDYSGGWATDATNANTYYDGDASRLKRNDADKTNPKRAEYLTYYAPMPEDFTLTTYDYGVANANDNTIIEFYSSSDHENWSLIPVTKDGTVVKDKWSKVVYTNAAELDPSIKYVKIVVSNNTKIYAPQLSKLVINYAWMSERIVMDSMLDDSRTYEVHGDAVYMKTSGTAFGGDKDVLMKSGPADATLLYSYTNIENAELTAFIAKADGGDISIASSKDGVTFKPVAFQKTVSNESYDNYNKTIYEIDTLEDGTNYVLITISGGENSIAISNLRLSYVHEIVPIQKVHFKDERLEAVMKYDLIPAVKIAPMNATGDLEYSILDKDIATVNNVTGTVQARALGSTILKSTILGTTESASIEVRTSQNLALNTIVTASSVNGTYAVARAIDGNYLTRWESASGNVQWFQIDMGTAKEFGAIELNWQQFATEYVVQGSLNGNDWVDLFDEKNGRGGDVWIEFDDVQKYRYLRLSGTKATASYSLYEFRILSFQAQRGVDGVVLQNIALGKTATTSGNDTTNGVPGAAIDGNTSTRWASKREDKQWYKIDLGTTSRIYQLNLLWESAYGKEYDLQVIDETGKVTTVVQERSGSAGWKRYTLDEPIEGRYVQMSGIVRGSQYGYSLFEFEVYGSMVQTAVKSVEFASNNLSILKNHKKTAVIITDPPVLNEGSVRFVSLNPEIATVSNKGVVTGITLGSTTIMVYSSSSDAVHDSIQITVTDYNGAPIPVSNLEMRGGVAIIEQGTTAQFDATVTPDNASIKNIRWTSSDERIMLVTNEGLIKALALGSVTVRAVSVANPELVFEQEIRVVDAAVETVKALIHAIGVVSLTSKNEIDAAREAYDQLPDHKKLLVDNYDELTAAELEYAELVEAAERVNGVALDKDSMSLTVGESRQLLATITPSSALNKGVTWTTSNAKVANVDNNGYVTAIGPGSAAITVITEDGGKSAIAQVSVTSIPSSGGDGSSGSSGSPGTIPPVTPEDNRPGTIMAPKPVVDHKGAASTSIDAAALTKAFTESRKATVIVPKAEGVASYEAVFPPTAWMQQPANNTIVIETELGNIAVPGNALSSLDLKGDKQISFTIATTVASVNNEQDRATIGTRPVVELYLSIDGGKVSWSGLETPIAVGIPYSPTPIERANPEHIVIWFIDHTGKAVAVPTGKYDAATGMVHFTTSQLGQYAVSYVKKSFSDLGKHSWASKAIEIMASKGVILGTSETSFNPSADITRADFVLLLVRALGLTAAIEGNFEDVSSDAYYGDALAIAKALDITRGVGNNHFNPQGKITREEMMTLAARAMKKAGKTLADAADQTLHAYSDAAQISDYALNDIKALVQAGLIKGNGGSIHPKGAATRAEVAVFVYNLYKE